jgi:hypothetical protein
MYVTREGIRVGPVIFADDNLSPLSLTHAEQINPILDLYNRYNGVSGLNINVRKSTILCINCTPDLTRNLQNQGFSTSTHNKTPWHRAWAKHTEHHNRNPKQDRPQSNQKKNPCHGTTRGYPA